MTFPSLSEKLHHPLFELITNAREQLTALKSDRDRLTQIIERAEAEIATMTLPEHLPHVSQQNNALNDRDTYGDDLLPAVQIKRSHGELRRIDGRTRQARFLKNKRGRKQIHDVQPVVKRRRKNPRKSK